MDAAPTSTPTLPLNASSFLLYSLFNAALCLMPKEKPSAAEIWRKPTGGGVGF